MHSHSHIPKVASEVEAESVAPVSSVADSDTDNGEKDSANAEVAMCVAVECKRASCTQVYVSENHATIHEIRNIFGQRIVAGMTDVCSFHFNALPDYIRSEHERMRSEAEKAESV